MISYIIGDATTPQGKKNKIIVHVCNDLGKWGKGFVLSISYRWPQVRDAYIQWCNNDNSKSLLGEIQIVRVEDDIWIANMVAQQGIRSRSNKQPLSYKALEQCLEKVALYANELNAEIHMPKIGCGLAGGKWPIIEKIIYEKLEKFIVKIYLYEDIK